MLQKRTNLAIFSAESQSIWPDATALLFATKPTTLPPRRPNAVIDLPGALGLDLEVVAVVADLLDDDRHVERRVEAGRRVERLLEQGVDLPGLAVERVGRLLERRARRALLSGR